MNTITTLTYELDIFFPASSFCSRLSLRELSLLKFGLHLLCRRFACSVYQCMEKHSNQAYLVIEMRDIRKVDDIFNFIETDSLVRIILLSRLHQIFQASIASGVQLLCCSPASALSKDTRSRDFEGCQQDSFSSRLSEIGDHRMRLFSKLRFGSFLHELGAPLRHGT